MDRAHAALVRPGLSRHRAGGTRSVGRGARARMSDDDDFEAELFNPVTAGIFNIGAITTTATASNATVPIFMNVLR